MATTSKYFVTTNVDNYTDFEMNYGTLSWSGHEEIVFTGGSGIDSVFVRPGMVFDFTSSGSKQDKVYLSGNWGDYTRAVNTLTGVLTLTHKDEAGRLPETVMVSPATLSTNSDLLVFADGTVNTREAYDYTNTGGSEPLPSQTETSLNPVLPATAPVTVKAFALTANGEIFAQSRPGVNFVVVGGAGIDQVYVKEGATVDATALGRSADKVYFTGKWGDYTKTIDAATSTMMFTRDINGNTEKVTVAYGSDQSSPGNDYLVFRDGQVMSVDAKVAVTSNSNAAITAVNDYNQYVMTPLGAPVVSQTLGVSDVVVTAGTRVAGNTYRLGDDVVVTIHFDKVVAVDKTGGTPTLGLTVGAVGTGARSASYVSGSGTDTLSFKYTIAAGDPHRRGKQLLLPGRRRSARRFKPAGAA